MSTLSWFDWYYTMFHYSTGKMSLKPWMGEWSLGCFLPAAFWEWPVTKELARMLAPPWRVGALSYWESWRLCEYSRRIFIELSTMLNFQSNRSFSLMSMNSKAIIYPSRHYDMFTFKFILSKSTPHIFFKGI